MPVVIRRTETLSDRIADLTIKTINIGNDQITSAKIASRAVGSPELGSAVIRRTMYGSPVDYTKADLVYQSGSGTPPYAFAYVSFPTAYGTPPAVSLTKAGETTTAPNYFELGRIRPGSFTWRGSPAQRYRWSALGFR